MSRYRGVVLSAKGRLPMGIIGCALLTSSLLPGCSSDVELMTNTIAQSQVGAYPGDLTLTPNQRAYLAALNGVGVHPTSALQALSIGTSVCQARAAGQSDHAVWQYVAPLVRRDVAEGRRATPTAASDTQLGTVISDYINVATQRLC